MFFASTVYFGRLFHSYIILIKKECLLQLTLADLAYNLQLRFDLVLKSLEIVAKIYILADSEDYLLTYLLLYLLINLEL